MSWLVSDHLTQGLLSPVENPRMVAELGLRAPMLHLFTALSSCPTTMASPALVDVFLDFPMRMHGEGETMREYLQMGVASAFAIHAITVAGGRLVLGIYNYATKKHQPIYIEADEMIDFPASMMQPQQQQQQPQLQFEEEKPTTPRPRTTTTIAQPLVDNDQVQSAMSSYINGMAKTIMSIHSQSPRTLVATLFTTERTTDQTTQHRIDEKTIQDRERVGMGNWAVQTEKRKEDLVVENMALKKRIVQCENKNIGNNFWRYDI